MDPDGMHRQSKHAAFCPFVFNSYLLFVVLRNAMDTVPLLKLHCDGPLLKEPHPIRGA